MVPRHYSDATGADAYAEVVPAPSQWNQGYTHVLVWNRGGTTNQYPARISFGGNDVHSVPVPGAGAITLDLSGDPVTTNIQAKNEDSGSNYEKLHIVVW